MNPCDQLDALAQGLRHVPDLIFGFSADARYLFLNEAAAAYLGCKEEEVIGYHWRDLDFPAEVMEPMTAKIAKVASQGESDRFQLRGSKERGGRIWDVSLTPLLKDEGGVVAVLAISRDVTPFLDGQ